ncbi:hypothetical protein PG357_04385 [Riemerella anatipestifer]|nr:hypothetical protein [Riemerella anatipestifer]
MENNRNIIIFFKKVYYYFIYAFYNFWEYVSHPKWRSEVKACILMAALQAWTTFAFIFFRNISISVLEMLFIGIITIVPHGYLILYKEEYRVYFSYFRRYSVVKRRILNIVVFFIVVIIFILYLKSMSVRASK